jgi:hypothetical protein
MTMNRDENCDLQKIPGVGKNIEEDLLNIGIRRIEDLKGKDPEELYQRDCIYKGFQEDRCQLYVFRSAVYFAEHEEHEAGKLKWWYWKDKEYPEKEQK